MLLFLVILALIVVLLSWGVQAYWALRLAVRYPPRAVADDPDRAWPRVTVLLPLRGSDPVLADCLRGLCRQEYPSYQIHIIVDSSDDPAWATIREVLADCPTARV